MTARKLMPDSLSFQAELKRLCAQFRVVPNFHWIVVEDSAAKTRLVSDLLRSCGVAYTQLNVPTPEDWKIAEVSDKLRFLNYRWHCIFL